MTGKKQEPKRKKPKKDVKLTSKEEELRAQFVAARDRAGLTQREASAEFGVTDGTISKKERGETPVKPMDVMAMEWLAAGRSKELVEKVPRGTVEPEPDAGEQALTSMWAWRRQRKKAGASKEEISGIDDSMLTLISSRVRAAGTTEAQRKRYLARAIALMNSDIDQDPDAEAGANEGQA